MAAKKYRSLATGKETLETAVVTSAGAANDGDLVALDALGKLDASVMPLGIGADTVTVLTSEALATGDHVNIFNNAGVLNARKADASVQTKPAVGFVRAAFASGASATVFKEGTNDQLAGKTIGARQYLSSTVPGATTETPVTGVGKLHQYIGVALSAVAMDFEPDEPVLLNA